MVEPLLLALVWQPIASPLRIVGGGGLLAAIALFAYLRIASHHPHAAITLLVMRLGVIVAVCCLLWGPSREYPATPQGDRPALNILVDTSESMLTGDCEGTSRITCVAEQILTPDQLRSLRESFEVTLEAFDDRIQPLSLERLHADPQAVASGRSTRLAAAAMSAIARKTTLDSGSALVIISDGRDTEDAPVQPAAALAASKGVPIYTIGVGGTQASVDAALLAVPRQDALLPGEPGSIIVKVYQSGLDGETGEIRLTSDDETQRVPILFQRGQLAQTQLNLVRDEPGQYEVEIALVPLPGETDPGNNTQTVFFEVMKRRIRVLMLEGEPYWDSKFLAQSLRKDEQVELTQITQVGSARQERILSRTSTTSAAIPQTVDEWAEYDVVILGRRLERTLTPTAAAALADYVSRAGGHLVFARGQAWDRNTPEGQHLTEALTRLEPVLWNDGELQDLSLSITPSGRTAAWFAATKMGIDPHAALQRLPGFLQMQAIDREKSGALVLARAAAGPTAEGLPAITRMTYGRGQVVAILGDGLWRWSLLPPELQDLRGFYDTFWSNLVRWLALGGDFAPGQQVSLQLSRSSVRLSDDMTIDVAYKQSPASGTQPRLEITAPDGRPRDVPLHELPGQTPRYRANFRPESAGVHEVVVHAPGATPSRLARKFNVYDVNLERLQTSANFLTLQMLAEHSGGAMFDASSGIGPLHEALQRHREASIVPPRREYIWDHGLIMTLLLLWAGSEWLLRRGVGLW